jgi:hypothetical protein
MKILSAVLFLLAVMTEWSMAANPDTTSPVLRDKKQFQIPSWSDKTKATVSPKSSSKALTMALGHTAIPIAAGLGLMTIGDSNVEGLQLASSVSLITYGGLVGPSMGNFYAKDYVRGGLGIAMRTVGTLMIGRGIASGMAWGNDDEAEGPAPGGNSIAIGTALVFGSALWNILSAPSSANTYNRRVTNFSVGYDPISKTSLAGVRITF